MRTIIFVSDMFVDQYSGGAELTTAALMMTAPKDRYGVGRLNSKDVTKEMLEKHKNDLWVVCNFTDLSEENKIYMCRNVEYSIIEYDYKLCEFRSLQKHKMATGSECNCLENISGKINMAFYGYAKKIWFMSEGQKKVFFSKLPVLKEDNKYLILGSQSWIKGTEDCIAYAKANDLKYELVQNLTYHELLIKMSCSRGLIFRPLGDDTCPRISIEARLLGCELITNEHVQHRDESWFATPESAHEYMSTRSDVFWSHYAQ